MGGINVRREVSFLHGLSIEPGPFQSAPLLNPSLRPSFLHPSYPHLFPKVSDYNTSFPIGGLYGCRAVGLSHGSQCRCSGGAILWLVLWFTLFLQQPDFFARGFGPRRVGSESGSSSYQRRVSSTSCGSFIGRECYESWVDLLSSLWHTIFATWRADVSRAPLV